MTTQPTELNVFERRESEARSYCRPRERADAPGVGEGAHAVRQRAVATPQRDCIVSFSIGIDISPAP